MLEPLVVSWGYESEKPTAARFIDEQEWTGTRDMAAYLSVPEAIRFYAEHHWEEIPLHCHELACQVRERVSALTGLPPLSPDSTDWYMQIVSLALPPCDPESVKGRLMDEFRIEVPVLLWNARPFIRVSVQAYNTQADADRLVEALKVIFKEGKRHG